MMVATEPRTSDPIALAGWRWLAAVSRRPVVDVGDLGARYDTAPRDELVAAVVVDASIDRTDRAFYETRTAGEDGVEAAGWARHRLLDVVLVIGDASLRAVLLDVRRFRAFVGARMQDGLRPGWNMERRTVNGRVAHGIAVPLDQLRFWSVVRGEVNLARFMADTEPGGEDAVVALVESRRKR